MTRPVGMDNGGYLSFDGHLSNIVTKVVGSMERELVFERKETMFPSDPDSHETTDGKALRTTRTKNEPHDQVCSEDVLTLPQWVPF
jgi:hypothetical protein